MSAMTLIHWETTDNCFSSLGHFFNNSAIIPGKEAELRNMSGHDLPHYHFNQALPKTSGSRVILWPQTLGWSQLISGKIFQQPPLWSSLAFAINSGLHKDSETSFQ